jgi:hypothetical protein
MTGGSNNRLPFFYSLQQAIQAFRLPLPDSKAPEGITLATCFFYPIAKEYFLQKESF